MIAYSSYKGRPMEQEQRDKYAWYLPMTFGPHFLGALGQGRSRVDIHFLEPVLVTEFSSRKACADHCETEIRRGLLEILKLDQEECPERYRPYSRRWKRHTGSAAGAAVN